jgi:hypothetical protein
MLRVRKRSVLLFPALGGLGVTAYYQSNNAVQREWDAFFESYMRIFRLMGTVGAMTFDYAYQLYVKDKDFREKN